MSRIGKQPITIPKGVEVKVVGQVVHVKGPKDTLEQEVLPGITVNVADNIVTLTYDESKDDLRPFLGLFRSLINNMVIGTTEGFKKELVLEGVGFRAAVQANELVLNIGFSHQCKCEIPAGLEVAVEKGVNVVVSGADKQKVGQFAAFVRSKRKPEPYKGKGIRYKDEYIRRKAGKSSGK